jgi:hypothetical protein
MNKITCDDLEFEDKEAAIKFITDNKIELYIDELDIILCYQSKGEDITSNWYDITTQTALYFQSNLIDEITSKNLLLVFCSSNEIDIDTKNKIQSDTYCCRKIARSNVVNTEENIKELIFYQTNQPENKVSISLKELIRKNHPDVFKLMALK